MEYVVAEEVINLQMSLASVCAPLRDVAGNNTPIRL
jgi:hypothetical protein